MVRQAHPDRLRGSCIAFDPKRLADQVKPLVRFATQLFKQIFAVGKCRELVVDGRVVPGGVETEPNACGVIHIVRGNGVGLHEGVVAVGVAAVGVPGARRRCVAVPIGDHHVRLAGAHIGDRERGAQRGVRIVRLLRKLQVVSKYLFIKGKFDARQLIGGNVVNALAGVVGLGSGQDERHCAVVEQVARRRLFLCYGVRAHREDGRAVVGGDQRVASDAGSLRLLFAAEPNGAALVGSEAPGAHRAARRIRLQVREIAHREFSAGKRRGTLGRMRAGFRIAFRKKQVY